MLVPGNKPHIFNKKKTRPDFSISRRCLRCNEIFTQKWNAVKKKHEYASFNITVTHCDVEWSTLLIIQIKYYVCILLILGENLRGMNKLGEEAEFFFSFCSSKDLLAETFEATRPHAYRSAPLLTQHLKKKWICQFVAFVRTLNNNDNKISQISLRIVCDFW